MSLIDKYFIKRPAVRSLITKLIYRNREILINIFDTRLFINTLKENGYFRAFKLSRKSSLLRDEISVLLTLANLIDNRSTFVDVGANVGLFCSTINRFQSIYPSLKIYAFEANPDTYKRLSVTTEGTNIKAFNYAVSNLNGELEFVKGAVSHVFAEKSHINKYHYKNQALIKVPAKRLDEFDIPGNEIILKIDVEGHEYEVLQGAESLFEQKRIKAVYMDGFKNSSIIPFLKKYDFKFYDGRTLESIQDKRFAFLARSPSVWGSI